MVIDLKWHIFELDFVVAFLQAGRQDNALYTTQLAHIVGAHRAVASRVITTIIRRPRRSVHRQHHLQLLVAGLLTQDKGNIQIHGRRQ